MYVDMHMECTVEVVVGMKSICITFQTGFLVKTVMNNVSGSLLKVHSKQYHCEWLLHIIVSTDKAYIAIAYLV